MTQKIAKKNGQTRATLADIAREMAKPRLAESVRAAVEAEEEATRVKLLLRPREGARDSAKVQSIAQPAQDGSVEALLCDSQTVAMPQDS